MTTTHAAPVAIGQSVWQIDPAHTLVEFQVKHMMFAKVRGRFDGVEGTINYPAQENVAAGSVNVSIRVDTVSTGNSDRDNHLRSPDFFDTAAFPVMNFRSRTATRDRDGRLSVTGDLTIRDVTREVTLTVDELGSGIDPWGNDRVGFTATTKLDRRDFGLTWNQALEAGGILVGNEIDITLEVQAIRQKS